MNERDYLRSIGFTVGERGRFSAAMLAALDVADVDFSKPPAEPGWVFADEVARPDLPHYVLVKHDGITERWSECNTCLYSMKYCRCPKPTIPSWWHDVEIVE